MSTTIEWKIQHLETKPVDGNFTNVVVTAHWMCIGRSNNIVTQIAGARSLFSPSNIFTPYEELTKEQVLQWCWDSGVNKQEAETIIEKQIELMTKPSVVVLPLPWEN